jgi:SAM-dependent methyltransferase
MGEQNIERLRKTYANFWAERLLIRWKQTIAETEDFMKVYRTADFLREALSLSAGQRVLDLGCGAGEHCLALAQRGINATGIDIVPVLVDYARQQAAEAGVSAEFLCADMRTFRPQVRFDAVFTSSGTFGLTNDADNQAVLKTISVVLAHEGKFLIGPSNPELLKQESFHRRNWFFVEDGYLLREISWDRSTSSLCENFFFIDATGTITEFSGFDNESKGISGKVYSLPRLEKMIEVAGLVFEATYGSFELPPKPYVPDTPRLLILGSRKRAEV